MADPLFPADGKPLFPKALFPKEELGITDYAVGIGETVLQMGSSFAGAVPATGYGVFNAIREEDVFAYTPAFEVVNHALTYEPRTEGGKAVSDAVARAFEWYDENIVDEYLVKPNLEQDNVIMATVGKTAGHALALLAPMKAGAVVEPSVKLTSKAAKAAAQRSKVGLEKLKSRFEPKQEHLVEVETGKPVELDAIAIPDEIQASTLQKLQTGTHLDKASAAGRNLFFKPVQVVRNWKSQATDWIADNVFAPTKADAKLDSPVPRDFIEASNQMHGEFLTRLEGILEPYRNRFGVLPAGVDKTLNRALRTGHTPVRYRSAVLEIKELLREFGEDYAKPVLPEMGLLENYSPQTWDLIKIERAPRKFMADLMNVLKFDEAGARETTRRIITHDGSPQWEQIHKARVSEHQPPAHFKRLYSEGGASRAPMEQARKIVIPDEVLPRMEEWLVEGVEANLTRYFRRGTNRVEYARRFGSGEEVLNRKVLEAIDELGIQNSPREIRLLTRSVYDMMDALQGNYRPIESMTWRKWNRRLANLETTMHLGLVSLASLPEFAAPAVQFGFIPKAYAKGVLHAVGEATAAADRLLTGRRHIPKLHSAKELERMGEISLSTLDSAVASRFNSFGGTFTNKFMKATLLEYLTDVQRVIAYESIQSVVKRNANHLAKGTKGKKTRIYRDQLVELGIEPEKAIQWAKDGNQAFQSDLALAGQRGQRWAITNPNPATRPLLFSDPHWTNVLLFKSFTTVFSNLFLKRALKELGGESLLGRKAGAVAAIAGSIGIAYYTQYLREAITGHSPRKRKDEVNRWMDAVDRSAMTGDLTHIYVLANPYRYGYTDASALRIFNLAGPAIGDTAKIMDAALKGDDKQRAKTASKLIPGVNMVGPLREEVEEALR